MYLAPMGNANEDEPDYGCFIGEIARMELLELHAYVDRQRRQRLNAAFASSHMLKRVLRQAVNDEEFFPELIRDIRGLIQLCELYEGRYRAAHQHQSGFATTTVLGRCYLVQGDSPSERAQALSRRIFALCHPDKTDDVRRHNLFDDAMAARHRVDCDELIYLYYSAECLVEDEAILKRTDYQEIMFSKALDLYKRQYLVMAPRVLHRLSLSTDYERSGVPSQADMHYLRDGWEWVHKKLLKYVAQQCSEHC